MTEKAKKAGMPARPKKQELLSIQAENFAALQKVCNEYISSISDAAFKQCLQQTHPGDNLMEDVPLDVVAKAAAVASAVRSAALGEGLFVLLSAAILTAPQALRSRMGRKGADGRAKHGGGRPTDGTPWVISAKMLARYKQIDSDGAMERLKSAQTIQHEDGRVRFADASGAYVELREGEFKNKLSKLISRSRPKKMKPNLQVDQ